jgi:peptide/nickel transport system substrate-binding protein
LLASAIDRTALVAGAIANLGTPSERLLPSGHWAAGDDAPSIETSPEQVRQGLAEMGITPGLPLNLIASEHDASIANTCVLLQDQLAFAGFAVNLELLSDAEMETAIKDGAYDLRAVYSPYWRDPHELIHPLLSSDGMANRGGFSSQEVDVLLSQATSQPYPDYRAVRYGAVQRVASMLTPIIPLFTTRYIDAMSSRLVNYPSMIPVSALGFRLVKAPGTGAASD